MRRKHTLEDCAEELARKVTMYTPGPWTIVDAGRSKGRHRWQLVGAEGRAALMVDYATDEGVEGLYNLHLVAAAPRLVEVLEAAVTWWHADLRHFTAKEPHWLPPARAALAAARRTP